MTADADRARTVTPWPESPARVPATSLRFDGRGWRGGSGTVYRLLGGQDLVYKRYDNRRPENDLTRLVALGNECGPADRGFLREHFAWPRAVVIDSDNAVAGVLLPRVPPAFEAALVTGYSRVRDFNDLLFEKRAIKAGIPPATRRQKLELVARLVTVIEWLNRHGLVHEDLAAQNILWRIEGGPGVMILDCDSVRPADSGVDEPLLTSLDWTDPRVLSGDVHRPDADSMTYALGLLAGRALGEPQWRPPADGRDNLPDGRVPEPLLRVVVDTVRPNLPRPSVAQWRAATAAVIEGLGVEAGSLTDADPAAVPTEAPPPIEYKGPGSDLSRRIAFSVGIALGFVTAVVVMLGVW